MPMHARPALLMRRRKKPGRRSYNASFRLNHFDPGSVNSQYNAIKSIAAIRMSNPIQCPAVPVYQKYKMAITPPKVSTRTKTLAQFAPLDMKWIGTMPIRMVRAINHAMSSPGDESGAGENNTSQADTAVERTREVQSSCTALTTRAGLSMVCSVPVGVVYIAGSIRKRLYPELTASGPNHDLSVGVTRR